MQATVRSISIMILLLLTSVFPVMTQTNSYEELNDTFPHLESTIGTDTTWSGEISITDNVTIPHGVKLTIKSGAFLNISADIKIQVSGILEANDTTINSSLQPIGAGSTGAGLWDGIVVEIGGELSLDNVAISNARTAISVSGSANITDVDVTTSFIGIDVDGQMDANTISCQNIDFECMKVSGDATVLGLLATNVSTGVSQTGQLELVDVLVESSGTAFDINGGTGFVSDIHVGNTSTGWRVRGTTSVYSMDSTSFGLGLLVDAGSSSGFEMNMHEGHSEKVIVADGVTDLEMNDIVSFSTNGSESTAIDVRNDGDLLLSEVELSGYSIGVELRGTGDTTIISSDVTVTDTALIASGSGILSIDDSEIHGGNTLGEFSQISTEFTNTNFVGGENTETGFSWTGGSHVLTDVNISRTYIGASDTYSEGFYAWWADVTVNDVWLSGWRNFVHCERCIVDGDQIRMDNGGANNGNGISVIDGDFVVSNVETAHMTTAANLEGLSTLVVESWEGEMHNTLVVVSEDSLAQIRHISTSDMTGTIAYGDGEMYWGSDETLIIATSLSDQYFETNITVTDLEGNPVSADVQVGPWEETADSFGEVTIPLFSSGNDVTASIAGAGAIKTLFGGIENQEIQLPIIPSGDWTISTGNDVVLGSTPDNSAHVLDGDLTITSGASLTLSSTTLELPNNSTLTIESGGTLIGKDGTVIGGEAVSASGDSALGGEDGGLHITIPTTIDCQSSSVSHLFIDADVVIGSGCDYTITIGEVSGDVETQSSDARLEVRNSLEVLVIDAGEPVQGALISVGGSSLVTDSEGSAVATETTRLDVNGSETVWTLWKYVQMQRGGHVQFYNWSLEESLSHTFISSTVPSGISSNDLVLEAEWSPWYLDSDLTISQGNNMRILDNTEVVIADGVGIIVEGILSIDSATLHSTSGSRWSGISVIGAGSILETSGSHLVEASQVITVGEGASITISNTEVARGDGLLTIGDNTISSIENSYFHDAMESCVMGQGTGASISIADAVFDNCGDHAIWARYADVNIESIILGNGSDEGLEISAVTGIINGVDASGHGGSRAAVHLSEIDGGLTVSNLNLSATSSAAFIAEMSRNIDVNYISAIGAPAIELDFVAGTISNLDLTGDGSGIGVAAHHSRGSGALEISESSVVGYSVALEIHGNSGEVYNPRLISSNNIFSGTTAVSGDGRNFVSINDDFSGAIELNSDVEIISEFYDSTNTNISVTGNASAIIWNTLSFSTTLDGLPVSAIVSVTSPVSGEAYVSQSSSTPSLTVPVAEYGSSESSIATSMSVSATAEGSLPYNSEIIFPADFSNLLIEMEINSNPVVQLINPDGDITLMQTQNLSFVANATDANSDKSSLSIEWTITDSTGQQVASSDEWEWWTDELLVGNYVANVVVMDPHGGDSDTSFIITITQLDSDGDWTETCDQDLWWDSSQSIDCGPDDLDDDDDNDGIDDIYDAWPNDPCATKDSDVDGMPDELTCPIGTTTNLVEDSDDDNDGISDSDELKGSEDSSTSMSMIAAVLLFIAIASLVVNRMRNQQ